MSASQKDRKNWENQQYRGRAGGRSRGEGGRAVVNQHSLRQWQSVSCKYWAAMRIARLCTLRPQVLRLQGLAVILNAEDNGHNQHDYFQRGELLQPLTTKPKVFLGILKGGSFFKKDPLLSGAAQPHPQLVKDKQNILTKRSCKENPQPVKSKQIIAV